jgi:hypothetical protein
VRVGSNWFESAWVIGCGFGPAKGLAVYSRWCYSNPWDAPLAWPVPALFGALNSAVECHLHTVEVAGSNPAAPTIESTTYRIYPCNVVAFEANAG